jgi:flagellar protein FlbD
MISCSDLHDRPLFINPDLLERIEMTPDTQLVFVNGKRTYVKETPEEIVERIVAFRRRAGFSRFVPLERSDLDQDEIINELGETEE